MKIGIRSWTTATVMILLTMLSVTLALPAGRTAPAPTNGVKTIGGTDVQQLGTLITSLRSSVSVANVLVASGLTNPTIAIALAYLGRGDVVVTIGDSLFLAPTLHMTSASGTLSVDLKTGATTPITLASPTADQAMNPVRLVTVAQRQGPTIHVSFYGLQVDSASLYQTLLQNAASEAATLSSVSFVAPAAMGDANGQWTKKYDVSYTYTVNGAGDYFYARWEIYQLNYWDTVSNTEYWRTDAAIDHLIKSYSCDTSHCGPYLNQRQVTTQATSGEIYKYAPISTNKDTTVQVNIGFDLSTSGGGVSVGYGWTWTNPGVSYAVQADRPNYKMNWQETFNGPDYTWWPVSVGAPTGGSHNSFQAEPTLVMRTPVQTGFNMQTLQSMYETYNDQLSCGFLCLTLQISRTTTDYYITYHPGQLLSMFGPQPTSIQINYNSVNDNYCRSVGVAIDRTLPNPWWPPYQSGYEVSPSGGVCGSWSYSTNPQMARGSHYLQTAVSGSVPSYEWNAKVYINGVLTAQGYVGRNQILQANFSV